ncbi:hypothetical protein GOP47_0001462 [Adiantum capillus-veneris]|uniref:Uncharacterized protein n=1 Tax=Adiantum capillus-veneris TaxID=13818 RepID=A0A9D4V8E4_ADICA|nr:hypothetical protein GOP47_0001462 [Adiantum capillus-veneris]
MAMVFGQTYYPATTMTEFKGGAGAATGEDSDDEEYVYVSRLAEQIAAHAMLDEEDDLPLTSRPQHPIKHYSPDIAFSSYVQGMKSQEKARHMQEVDHPVSRFAAVWRDHGPSEWDCFYTPSLQVEVSRQASFLNSQLHQIHKLQGWTSLCYENAKQAGSQVREMWDLPSHRKVQPFIHESPVLKRKESVGTGVFLPKVVSPGSHYRRKAGLSKSAYTPRGKLL